jgi:hypothetical protein
MFSSELKSGNMYLAYYIVYFGNFYVKNCLFTYFLFIVFLLFLNLCLINHYIWICIKQSCRTNFSYLFYMNQANTSSVYNGSNLIISTFIHLKGTDYYSPTIYIANSSANINISNSVFINIWSSYTYSDLCAVYHNMSTNGNGYYNV